MSRKAKHVDADVTMQSFSENKEGNEEQGRTHASSDGTDKGLKRKFVERGTSHEPPETEGDNGKPGVEPLKRPRDNADKDDNPREAKRPSPPPSPPRTVAPPSPKVTKAVRDLYCTLTHLLIPFILGGVYGVRVHKFAVRSREGSKYFFAL